MAGRYISGQVVPTDDIKQKMLEILGAGEPEAVEEGDETVQAALELIRELYESRLDDLRGSINDLKTHLRKEKIEKWVFVLLLALVVTFVFVLFGADLANGNVGWFRH